MSQTETSPSSRAQAIAEIRAIRETLSSTSSVRVARDLAARLVVLRAYLGLREGEPTPAA